MKSDRYRDAVSLRTSPKKFSNVSTGIWKLCSTDTPNIASGTLDSIKKNALCPAIAKTLS